MYRKITIIALVLSAASCAVAADRFFYGTNGRTDLGVDSTFVLIKVDSTLSQEASSALIQSVSRISATIQIEKSPRDGFILCSLRSSEDYRRFVDSLRFTAGIAAVEPYFVTDKGVPLYVGDAFSAAFKEGVGRSTVDSINTAYHVIIDHELPNMPGVYLLRNTKLSGNYTVDLANLYHDLSVTRYAAPVFGVRPVFNGYKLYDYYSYCQKHLKKIIGKFDTASVWDFSGVLNSNRHVTAAVLDDGIVRNHEDLPANRILSGWDFGDHDSIPIERSQDGHGMAAAGIIAASNTTDSVAGQQQSTGLFSLNPQAYILPLKISDRYGWIIDAEQLAEVFTFAQGNGAEVISNSWDFPYDCRYADPTLDDAIYRAFALGRHGKGCPVIFASGNFPGPPVVYPACLSTCYAVGAVDTHDSLWWYSAYGSELDAVAPTGDVCLAGDEWTLDQMDTLGFNTLASPLQTCSTVVNWMCGNKYATHNYDCHYGGTSAASPKAAGIAALLLGKDSTLTARQVYNILDSSAVPLAPSVPSVYFGYGRLDAYRAVLSISHGDVNNDGGISSADLTALINYLTGGGFRPFPALNLADFSCDGHVDSADLSALVSYLVGSGPAPKKPCFAF
jgi:serine protease